MLFIYNNYFYFEIILLFFIGTITLLNTNAPLCNNKGGNDTIFIILFIIDLILLIFIRIELILAS